MIELAKGWARVGAWVTVGAGAVAALLGASALSMLAAMAQRVAGKAMTREEMDREIERAILGRKRQPWQVTPQERAERKAAKAAKQAAREERKRMRRWHAGIDPIGDVAGARIDLAWARGCLVDARGLHWSRVGRQERVTAARRRVRDLELRYAIACAEAGAVPGGRVH